MLVFFFFFLWCLRSWKSLGFVVSLDFASGGSKSCKEVGFCFLIVEINILVVVVCFVRNVVNIIVIVVARTENQ